ncbi:DUF418 domain-containing protein [Corynebacterium sp. NPDC060344]|uniref:DUF418 domain-containing protein n=1 Tax=Corynebacterium sp. NPDC060344 TaxID=3347101 RepID=UPI0036669844
MTTTPPAPGSDSGHNGDTRPSSSGTTSTGPTSAPAGKKRIVEIDAVRGFALCGIHVVNVYQQVVFPAMFGELRGKGVTVFPDLVRYGFYERFFPIFTLLFGLGFAIFLESAAAKTDSPRTVLARRLVALAVIGIIHQVFHQGEALLPYAIFGLIFLLPASFLKPWPTVAVGIVLLLIGGQVIAGYGVMPGLLVIGLALAGLGVHRTLRTHTGAWAAVTAIFGAITAAHWWSVWAGIDLPRLSFGLASLPDQLAGVATGMFFACLLILLMRIPIGRPLAAVLAPMGRMALTNYLMATVLILAASPALGIADTSDWPQIAGLVVGIIVVEAIWSPLWLARFRYGPAEWAWRCVTWWRKVPIRR